MSTKCTILKYSDEPFLYFTFVLFVSFMVNLQFVSKSRTHHEEQDKHIL